MKKQNLFYALCVCVVSSVALSSCKQETLMENGHEYVDLGLSVNWATCNVGAKAPQDFGYYYAWGETMPKDKYLENNYKHFSILNNDKDNFLTILKYCDDYRFRKVDHKIQLEREDDAAHVNWGGKWRTPTPSEVAELIEKCEWKWTTMKGVDGYKVIGPNGHHIFLPVSGYRNDEPYGYDAEYAASIGGYWSNTITSGEDNDFPYNAICLMFTQLEGASCVDGGREIGLAVRPVWGTFTSPDLKWAGLHDKVQSVKEITVEDDKRSVRLLEFDENGMLVSASHDGKRYKIERDDSGRISTIGNSTYLYNDKDLVSEKYEEGFEWGDNYQCVNNDDGWCIYADVQCLGDCSSTPRGYTYSYPKIDDRGNWLIQNIEVVWKGADCPPEQIVTKRVIEYWN